MKHFAILAVIVAAVMLLAGCGGSKKHGISTPFNGSIDGVETAPPDGDTNVGIDTWIEVYWPHSYFAPPRRFTFKLERRIAANQYQAVRTYLDRDSSFPEEGSWWFAPEDYLAYDSTYRITVTDNYGDYYRAYFDTESSRSRSADAPAADKRYRPEGPEHKPTGTAADEHTIETSIK